MKRLLCALGLHRWTPWTLNGSDTKQWQERHCLWCHLTQRQGLWLEMIAPWP